MVSLCGCCGDVLNRQLLYCSTLVKDRGWVFWFRVKKLLFVLSNEKVIMMKYRDADKSLTRPISRCISFNSENISFDASLVMYINKSNNISPIMIINRIYVWVLYSMDVWGFL